MKVVKMKSINSKLKIGDIVKYNYDNISSVLGKTNIFIKNGIQYKISEILNALGHELVHLTTDEMTALSKKNEESQYKNLDIDEYKKGYEERVERRKVLKDIFNHYFKMLELFEQDRFKRIFFKSLDNAQKYENEFNVIAQVVNKDIDLSPIFIDEWQSLINHYNSYAAQTVYLNFYIKSANLKRVILPLFEENGIKNHFLNVIYDVLSENDLLNDVSEIVFKLEGEKNKESNEGAASYLSENKKINRYFKKLGYNVPLEYLKIKVPNLTNDRPHIKEFQFPTLMDFIFLNKNIYDYPGIREKVNIKNIYKSIIEDKEKLLIYLNNLLRDGIDISFERVFVLKELFTRTKDNINGKVLLTEENRKLTKQFINILKFTIEDMLNDFYKEAIGRTIEESLNFNIKSHYSVYIKTMLEVLWECSLDMGYEDGYHAFVKKQSNRFKEFYKVIRVEGDVVKVNLKNLNIWLINYVTIHLNIGMSLDNENDYPVYKQNKLYRFLIKNELTDIENYNYCPSKLEEIVAHYKALSKYIAKDTRDVFLAYSEGLDDIDFELENIFPINEKNEINLEVNVKSQVYSVHEIERLLNCFLLKYKDDRDMSLIDLLEDAKIEIEEKRMKKDINKGSGHNLINRPKKVRKF